MKNIAVIDAPSILGLRPSGVERLPEALRGAGLVEKLGAFHLPTSHTEMNRRASSIQKALETFHSS
jgi:hypothetical protein